VEFQAAMRGGKTYLFLRRMKAGGRGEKSNGERVATGRTVPTRQLFSKTQILEKREPVRKKTCRGDTGGVSGK